MDANEERWSVGDLAAAAGVTVQTLHHYDRLGLLEPVERTAAGYRQYDRAGVERLYRILALRGLGFPLGEVGALLDADAGSLREATRARLERTEMELARGADLRERLLRVLDQPEPPAAELIDTMEVMSMNVQLNRIVTRGGDAGETDRGDGARVRKDAPLIEAGGEVDALCAGLGLALSLDGTPADQAKLLREIQNDLFDLGAELATGAVEGAARPLDGRASIDDSYVARLDQACADMNADLAPLDSFLLPGGGSPYSAQLQVCRTTCRRAERRLSDLLFIMARAAEPGSAAAERTWVARRGVR